MFHMLTCFNLQPGISIDEFRQSVAVFTTHLASLELIESRGPIGHRQSDTVLDTDGERDHEYFFIMSFRDRAQSNRATEHIYKREEPGNSIHKSVFSKIKDEVFICWADIPGEF